MTIKVTYNVTDVYMSQSVSPVYINVSYSDGGASGGGVWGSITGTLSNQTDLQTALDLKVPYTGATGNVNIGEYELKAGQVTLDTSPTGTAAVGTIRWNDTTGTSETTLKGGNVIIKNGVDLVARVVNKVSPNTTLTKAAYQAVRVSGAQGQRLAIELAQANNDAGSADTIGLVTETIAPNQEGFIMTVGQLEGINTTGSLQGETWADGDVLYLSPTTAGAITNVKPTGATGHLVIIGYVEYAHANNGKLYIKVANGFEIDELHNVSIVTPTDNQGLFYNATSTLWENKSITTALGYTPVPTTRNITINGVTYDLSADRTYTISTGISGSGASGQVTYWTGASAVSGSNNLFWDNANGRLGIGTNAPAALLDIYSSVNANSSLQVGSSQNTRVSINTQSGNRFGILTISRIGDGATPCISIGVGTGPTSSSGIISTNNDNLIFGYNVGNTFTETFRINTLNRLLLGFTTDQAVKLAVNGDTLLRGSGNTSATTALTVQNSASATMMSISNDAVNTILNISGSTYSIFQANQTTANRSVYFGSVGTSVEFGSGTAITNYTFISGGGYGLFKINTTPFNVTGGDVVEIPRISTNFNPTSGSANLTLLHMRPNINQTGGANGITRGLYVNPTLTAAADFRAIETTAGNVLFGSNFFWDNTNGRLGIGTNAPESVIHLNGASVPRLTISETGRSEKAYFQMIAGSVQYSANAYFDATNWQRNNTALPSWNLSITPDTNDRFTIRRSSAASGTITWTELLSLRATGNLLLNGSTDNGQRLQVYGDTLLRGSGATSATTALTVQNSSSTNLFTVQNNGVTTISATGNNNTTFSTTGQSVYNTYAPSGQNSWIIGVETQYFLGYSGRNILLFSRDRNHTTGGIDNNYIGFGHLSPTANVDIAASSTARASLRIRSGVAPTTPNDGDIWFDGTDIKMRIGGVTKTFTLV